MSQLSEEQRLMRQSCRDFVDDVVIPFIRGNWQREWIMTPENRLPPEILDGADKIGIRTLGVPEEFGGVELEPGTEVQTFALISEEIARGDSGLSDKLRDVLKDLRGESRLTTENIEGALRNVRIALLEADVNYQVVKRFIERARERALGTEVAGSLKPDQVLYKVVYDEMTEMLG